MALTILGKSICPICGKTLQQDDEIWGLPPISNTSHPLWEYFDAGLHKSCYENWDKKAEAEQLIALEQKA